MESLGGSLAGGPSSVSWGVNRIDVFAAGPGNTIWQWQWDGTRWLAPSPLSSGPANLPAETVCAASWGNNHLDVIAAGQGNLPWHWWFDGAWHGPLQFPASQQGIPAEEVALVSPAFGVLHAFAAGPSAPWHWSWSGAWSQGQLLPLSGAGQAADLPAQGVTALSSGGVMHVFAAGRNGNAPWHWRSADNGITWSSAEQLPSVGPGAQQVNLPAERVAAVDVGGTVHVFAPGAGNNLWHWWGGGSSPWSGPESLGGNLPAQGVRAVSPAPNRIDVFAIAAGGSLVRWQWDGTHWIGPVSLGGNLPAGDIAAVVRAPGSVDVFARGADGTLQHWPSGAGVSGEYWSNWAGNQGITPVAHCHPATLEDLVATVQQAEREGKCVRAVGSSWSFTDIAPSPDYLVETKQLNRVLTTVLPAALAPAASGRRLVHAEAGMKVADLCAVLDSMHFALPTMGGADGQTIAGVLSTSVHGPDFDRGPLPDMVRAIHLVGPGGVQYWIESPSQSFTNPTALAAALNLPAGNIKYDADWLNSVVVSVGSLGILYSVVIEVPAQYDLVETITTQPDWPMTRAQLVSGAAFATPVVNSRGMSFPNHAVQIAIDPTPGHACYLYQRATAPASAPAPPGTQPDPLGLLCTTSFAKILIELPGGASAFLLAAKDILPLLPPPFDALYLTVAAGAAVSGAVVAPLIDIIKALGPGSVGNVLALALNDNPDLTAQAVSTLTRTMIPVGTREGFAHTLMAPPNPGECAARGLSIELAFDATNGSHVNFVNAALPLLDQWKQNEGLVLTGWFSLRFVGQSSAYLSPQNRTSLTCMIEVTGIGAFHSTATILDRLEALGRTHGAIQHWGMFRNLTEADVTRGYPSLDAWRKVRWQLTNHGALPTFDNAFSRRVGLSRPPGYVAGGRLAVVAWGRNRLDIFGIGTDGAMYHKAWDGASWQPSLQGWESLGGAFTSPPAVAAWGSDRLDIFGIGPDGAMYHKAWDGASWQPSLQGWESLGGVFASPPAVVAWGSNRLDIFGLGTNGGMYHKAWDGASWQPSLQGWDYLGGVFHSPPAVVAWGSNRLDIVGLGSDGAMHHKAWDGAAWQPAAQGWDNLGGAFTSPPAVVAWGSNRLDIFGLGTDKAMYHKSWDGASWQPSPQGWESLGGVFSSPPAVAAWGSNRLDIFGLGTDNVMYHKAWDGASWQPSPQDWESMGGVFSGPPAVVAWGSNRLDVFGLGTDNAMYHKAWDGASWQPSPQGWESLGGVFIGP